MAFVNVKITHADGSVSYQTVQISKGSSVKSTTHREPSRKSYSTYKEAKENRPADIPAPEPEVSSEYKEFFEATKSTGMSTREGYISRELTPAERFRRDVAARQGLSEEQYLEQKGYKPVSTMHGVRYAKVITTTEQKPVVQPEKKEMIKPSGAVVEPVRKYSFSTRLKGYVSDFFVRTKEHMSAFYRGLTFQQMPTFSQKLEWAKHPTQAPLSDVSSLERAQTLGIGAGIFVAGKGAKLTAPIGEAVAPVAYTHPLATSVAKASLAVAGGYYSVKTAGTIYGLAVKKQYTEIARTGLNVLQSAQLFGGFSSGLRKGIAKAQAETSYITTGEVYTKSVPKQDLTGAKYSESVSLATGRTRGYYRGRKVFDVSYDDYFKTQTVNVKTLLKSKDVAVSLSKFRQQHPFILKESTGSYISAKKVMLGVKTGQMQLEIGKTASKGYIDSKPFSQSSSYKLFQQGVGENRQAFIRSEILGKTQKMGYFFKSKEVLLGSTPSPLSQSSQRGLNLISSVSERAGSIIATQQATQTSGLPGVIPITPAQQKKAASQQQSVSFVSQPKQIKESVSQQRVVATPKVEQVSVSKVISLPKTKESDQKEKQVLISLPKTAAKSRTRTKEWLATSTILSSGIRSETRQSSRTISTPLVSTALRTRTKEIEKTTEKIITRPKYQTAQVSESKYFVPIVSQTPVSIPKTPKGVPFGLLPFKSDYTKRPTQIARKPSKPSPYIKYSPDLTATFFNIKKKIDVEKEKKKKWSPFKLRPIPL